MAISTIDTYLYYKKKTGSGSAVTYSWAKLVDITEFPDLGASPDSIDVTTLSDKVQKNILGLQKLDNLEFGANYDKTDYSTIQALAEAGGDIDFAVQFGAASDGTPDGHNGIVTFSGTIAVYIKGGKTNEAVGMGITIACSEAPDLVASLPSAS